MAEHLRRIRLDFEELVPLVLVESPRCGGSALEDVAVVSGQLVTSLSGILAPGLASHKAEGVSKMA